MRMFKDPSYEMKSINAAGRLASAGDEVQSLAAEVVSQPPEVVAALKRILSQSMETVSIHSLSTATVSPSLNRFPE